MNTMHPLHSLQRNMPGDHCCTIFFHFQNKQNQKTGYFVCLKKMDWKSLKHCGSGYPAYIVISDCQLHVRTNGNEFGILVLCADGVWISISNNGDSSGDGRVSKLLDRDPYVTSQITKITEKNVDIHK
mmetsp:Transcript_21442/g.27730  ORF Transcript_21442/g.27730 Transcript_21442/m.27730 type:complete len:128 (+) Transcript_21442:1183-1566(+)